MLRFWVRSEIGEEKVVIEQPLQNWRQILSEKNGITYRMVQKRVRGLIAVG